MTPRIDNLIAKATLLRQVIAEIDRMLDECEDRAESGPPTLQPVYRQLSRILENDADSADVLAGRLGAYFNQNHDAELSQAQRLEMISFIEFCESPVVAALDIPGQVGYVRQISRSTGRDC